MAKTIVMPRLSDSMEEGVIVAWLKQAGDEVAVGDPIVEIETDKATMVYESDVAGVLADLVPENETVAVGAAIARVLEPGEDPGSPAGEQPGTEGGRPGDEDAEQASPAPDAPVMEADKQGAVQADVNASPLARRVARRHGLDLERVSGTGPRGRILKADVMRAVEGGGQQIEEALADEPAVAGVGAQPSQPGSPRGSVEVVELTRLQRTVAERMVGSKATVPHFFLQAEIDMSACVAARERFKSDAGEGEIVPSLNDMVVKACALALREHPRANGSYRDGRWELYSRVNVGVAVAAPDALVVPTIFDADAMGLRAIAAATRELAAKVRDRSITPAELEGATFTVSNLGMHGVTNFAPVINQPQAAILAVGAVSKRPVARGDELAISSVMEVTLACDHRILYGADAAAFLARIRSLLEEPLRMAL